MKQLFIVALLSIAAFGQSQIGGGGGAGGSGTVSNAAAAGNAYYAGAGTTVQADTALVDNGDGTQAATQGTITTSHPLMSHTVTWNAGGVAFTNWLSNITCTAAATASIAAGLGVGGTTWQFKFNGANCASPQLILPNGTNSAPSISFANGPTGGLYSNSAGKYTFSGGSGNGITLGATGAIANGGAGLFAFTASTDSTAAADVGLSRISAGVIGVGTGSQGNVAGTIQSGAYQTGTNCAAVGTAANPSVASCTSAAAGSVSCATNASGGTCTVNTTAVTANSEIFLEQRADTTTGTRLGVTCNTTKDSNSTAPQITAVTAATSFTFQLGTVATNPECFSYHIIN